jgi:hypothetical protein
MSETYKNIPDNFAFIIGAMKSGTTSLFDILSQHPKICPARNKEPDFFIKDRDQSSLDSYLALWDWKNNAHTVALESSVAYTKEPYITGVPERIQQSNLGQYKFIYMLRDPLSRIESQIRHGLFAGWGKSLDEGIPASALNLSRFAMQLDNYLKYFSKDNIMIITLEEFADTPHEILANICTFLGINSEFQFTNVTETRNSGDFFNSSPRISRVTQNHFGQLIAQKILPVKVKKIIRSLISKSNKNQTANHGRWQLTPEEKDLALRLLANDLGKLESKYNVNVNKYWHIQSSTLINK